MPLFIYFFLFILFLVLLFAVYLCVPTYRMHLHWKAQGVNTAPFVPLLGQLPVIARYFLADNPLGYSREYARRFGLIHSVAFGPANRLNINDPRYIQDVHGPTGAKKFNKPPLARILLGKGAIGMNNLLMTEREEHAKHRRITNPAFHHQNLKDMVELMVNETAAHIHPWTSAAADGAIIDLRREMSSLTFSIIAACAFGSGFASIPNARNIFYQGLERGFTITQRRLFFLADVLPIIRDLPILGKTERTAIDEEMKQLVDRVVWERKVGKTKSNTEGKQDLLDLLLSAKDPETGEGLTDAEVRDDSMTFVLAGHETTANTMVWMLFMLMSRPQLWSECVKEVESVCGQEPPSCFHLAQLPTLDAVLNETLRIFTPVPLIGRQVHSAHTIGHSASYPISLPAGAEVQTQVNIVHRIKQYWGDDADIFDHARWMKGKKPYSHPYAFIPFGQGPRGCIGLNFAQMEAKVMLVMILQSVSMDFVEGQKVDGDGYPIQNPGITLRPRYPMQVRLRPRTPLCNDSA